MHRRPSTNVTKFTAIAVNGFYTMTRSGLMTTADSDSPENIQCDELRTLAADEKAMKELYAQAEVLQTATQPKRLVVYKEYLLWFRDLPTNDEPRVPDSASTPHKGTLGAEALTSCSTSKASSPKRNTPVLEGYANIRGMYVESNHSTKIRQEGLHIFSTFKLQSDLISSPSEVIYVMADQQEEVWRTRLANCPVIFTNFLARYEQIAEVSSDSHVKILLVKDLCRSLNFMCKSRRLHSTNSEVAKVQLKREIIREASIQMALKHSQVVAEFSELQFDGESYHLIEAQQDAYRLSDWFDSFWQPEKLGPRAAKTAIVNMLNCLAGLMEEMHQHGISHGAISRDAILVNHQSFPPESQSASNPSHSVASDRKSKFSMASDAIKIFDKVTLRWNSLRTSEQHANSPDWNSIICAREYPELSIDPGIRQFWLQTSTDIKELGILLYELVFGMCIPKILGHAASWDRDFVACLLWKPLHYIGHRDPNYDLGEEVTRMIANMLDPDWKQRPVIIEVVQILQSLLVESEEARTPKESPNKGFTHFQSMGRSQLVGTLSLFRTEHVMDRKSSIQIEKTLGQTGKVASSRFAGNTRHLTDKVTFSTPMKLRTSSILKSSARTLRDTHRNEQEFSALRTVRPGGTIIHGFPRKDLSTDGSPIKTSVGSDRIKKPGRLLTLSRLHSCEIVERSKTLQLIPLPVKRLTKGLSDSKDRIDSNSAPKSSEFKLVKPHRVQTDHAYSEMMPGDISFAKPSMMRDLDLADAQDKIPAARKIAKKLKIMDFLGFNSKNPLKAKEPHLMLNQKKEEMLQTLPSTFTPEVLLSGRAQFSADNKLNRVTIPTVDIKIDARQSTISWRQAQVQTIIAYRDLIPKTLTKDQRLGLETPPNMPAYKIESITRTLEQAATAADTLQLVCKPRCVPHY